MSHTSTRVVHCRKESCDTYIGRPSRWGNPFAIGKDGTREEVIRKYVVYLFQHPELLRDIHELKGKVLGCWCKPQKCHGDVLAEIADGRDTIEDGFGSVWSAYCPECGRRAMHIVRPGKVQCGHCG